MCACARPSANTIRWSENNKLGNQLCNFYFHSDATSTKNVICKITYFDKKKLNTYRKNIDEPDNIGMASSQRITKDLVANNPMDAMKYSRFKGKDGIYDKVWEEKSESHFEAEFKQDCKTLTISGTRRKGFGHGGGRWVFEESYE